MSMSPLPSPPTFNDLVTHMHGLLTPEHSLLYMQPLECWRRDIIDRQTLDIGLRSRLNILSTAEICNVHQEIMHSGDHLRNKCEKRDYFRMLLAVSAVFGDCETSSVEFEKLLVAHESLAKKSVRCEGSGRRMDCF